MHELIWQNALKRYFEANNTSLLTQSGKTVNILSIGKHNHLGGPDFSSACIVVDSELRVGDIEFHKSSGLWFSHNHHTNPAYSNVILHIVFEDDQLFDANFETLVVTKQMLSKYIRTEVVNTDYDTASYDDFQQFAMSRLLRRTSEVYSLLQTHSIEDALRSVTENFLTRYFTLRTRHRYQADELSQMLTNFSNSKLFKGICNGSYATKDLEKQFDDFIEKEKIKHLGSHLKQEILTNAVLPLTFCIATSLEKQHLLLWYWTAKTRASYSVLYRNYPLISQEYIWQQQGMLEYYKEYTNRQHSNPADLLINYSIPDIISYYTLNKPPYFNEHLLSISE
jgi:hypothetical protein